LVRIRGGEEKIKIEKIIYLYNTDRSVIAQTTTFQSILIRKKIKVAAYRFPVDTVTRKPELFMRRIKIFLPPKRGG